MNQASKSNPVKALWQRFKARMKRTWIGWFYICARRDAVGNVLLVLLLLSFVVGSFGLSGYMAVRPYTSWDEQPCQTGTLVKAVVLTRGHSSFTLGRVNTNCQFGAGERHWRAWKSRPNSFLVSSTACQLNAAM